MEGINGFDRAVMAFVQEHCHNAVTDGIFPIITYLGEYGTVWIVLALLFLCFKKKRAQGLLMLCAIIGGFLVGEVLLKNLVCRPRPFQEFPGYTALLIPPPSGWSFPSGHSCSSFAAAAALCCQSRKWGVPALVLAGLIAFSRVFLFVHWPTDVLAGAALGILSGLLTCFLARRIPKPNSNFMC